MFDNLKDWGAVFAATAIAMLLFSFVIMVRPSPAHAQSCRELRQACLMKEQLGEQGRGNCRRYREQCEQQPDCAQLRAACMFKNEMGQQGQGNCRRYRETCT